MVKFAFEEMVCVHWLALAPYGQGCLAAKGGVVSGTDFPFTGLLRIGGVQTLSKHEQGVIAFSKGMSQIGTWPGSVISVVHLAVAEMHHQIFLVYHVEGNQFCGTD